MTDPQPGTGKKRRWPLVLGGTAAVFVGLIVLGLIVGPQEEESDLSAATASETTTVTATTVKTAATTTPTPTTTRPAATTTTTTTTTTEASPETTTRPAEPAATFADPRCSPADQAMIDLIAAGLTDETLTLDNAAAIDDGGLVFVGASMVRPDGKFENRSDVWVVQNSLPFSSTGGARNSTSWPEARDMLGISPGDDRVQAVDRCVIELTRG